MSQTAIIKNMDFSQGLVTIAPPHLLADGASPSLQNVDLSGSVGALVKRKGQSVEIAELSVPAFPSVSGLYQYIQQDGDKFIIASANDDIYSLTAPGTWTSIFTSASLDGKDVNFATFKDLLIAVSEVITTQKWTGAGATSALLGTPPANVKFVETHKSRVFMANSSAGKSRLHFSALDNPEDWTSTGDNGAGFIDISLDDGDQITGLASVGTILIVFKQLSTHAVFGFKPSNFVVRRLSSSVGCRFHRSIVKADAFALFLADRGIYSVSANGLALVSYNIRPTIEDLSDAVKGGVAAGRLKTSYWLAFDSDANSQNDQAYILDYVNGIWSKYTNIKSRVFLTKDDGTLLSGGSDKVIIREHNDTNDDEGAAINMIWQSKDYDFGDFDRDKQLENVWIFAKGTSGKNLTLDHLIEGKDQADAVTVDLSPAAGEDRVIKSQDMKQNSQGRYLALKLSNNETNAPIQVYGYTLHSTIREYQD